MVWDIVQTYKRVILYGGIIVDKNKVLKILESQANEKRCVHEQYEQACGIWCKFHHKWCADMSGRDNKNNCPEYTPVHPIQMAKAILDIINHQDAEIKRLKPFEEKIAEYNSSIRVEDMLVFADSLAEWMEFCDNLKAEARKEFSQKLENRILSLLNSATLEQKETICACIGINNNILEELDSENDA